MTSQRSAGWRPPVLLCLLLGLGSAGLVACGSSDSTGNAGSAKTDPLTFGNTTVPVAYVGEEFKANMLVSGGVGPYAYKLASGSLPPGLSFSGGVLSGTPTRAGSYAFTVEANDANLSNKVATYTLNVNDLPPLSLEPTLPPGEIRGETRVPVIVKAPRAVRAARFTWDLGKDVQVSRVQAADNSSPVFWRQEGGVLSVDLGFKAVPRSGARVALVTVKPVKAGALNATNFWFESRDGGGKVLGEKKRPEATPGTPPAALPKPATNTTPPTTDPRTPPKTTVPPTTPESKDSSGDAPSGTEPNTDPKTDPVTPPAPTPPTTPPGEEQKP